MSKVKAKQKKWNKELGKYETKEIWVENNLDSPYLEDKEEEFTQEELKELGLLEEKINKNRDS